MSYDEERRARALEIYKKMGWGENEVVKEIDMELWRMITDVMFGEIWSRPGLSLRERELITLGVLVADRAEGMKLHMRHAHNLGITCDEMRETILPVLHDLGLALEERDVRDDPEMERRYLLEIPVLLLGAEEVARHRVTPTALRSRLRELGLGGL